MSAFNTVIVPWRDRGTGRSLTLRVQFKYGDTWQYEYRLDDELRWGGNDVGRRDATNVVVDGVREPLPLDVAVPENFEVHIVNNKISNVLPATGRYNFVGMDEVYVILEP